MKLLVHGCPQRTLTRRKVLSGAAGSGILMALLPACTRSGGTVIEPAPGTAVIDAHCHVFNASDLPIRGFVQRVILGDEEDQVVLPPEEEVAAEAVLPWLAAVLADFLAGAAPSARRELAALRGEPGVAADLTWVQDDPARRMRLAQALERVLAEPEDGPGPQWLPDGADADGRRRLLGALAAEVGADFGPGVAADPDGADYEALAQGVLAGSGRLGRLFRWAETLTAPRSRIVREYVRFHGGDDVALLTPALVDFSRWLEDEPASPFADQVRVMEEIQARMDGPRLHCFAPFDPWREIVDRARGASPTALDVARWAVEDMGFVGVKLYPPMGFYPAQNAARDLPVPKRAADIPMFAAKLDAALEALYAWAEAEGVPIMAHANNSNGSAKGYGERARPRNWAPVLAAHPHLRLNLAHFGGFDETAGDDLAATWENDVGELIARGQGRVFADMSYFSEVLPGATKPADLVRLAGLLRRFAARYDPDYEALLYGSDWIMLGREPDQERYLSSFLDFLQAAGLGEAARARIFSRNAARFLGLGRGEKTRQRLETWYARRDLDAGWLAAFDGPETG